MIFEISRRGLLAGLGMAVLGLALAGFMFLETALAPKADLWPRWQAHDANSRTLIGHTEWNRFLKAYLEGGVDGINRVA